jgi:hypothetical protein
LWGTVRDESGAVVPGAQVRVQNTLTNVARQATTDRVGVYRIPGVDPGRYQVNVEKPGFKRSVQAGVLVVLDRATVSDHTIQVGDISESVVVSETAHLLEANSSVISGLMHGSTIEALPLDGRDYLQLATLFAGAPPARAQSRNSNNGYGIQISFAGGRPSQNGLWLDGVSQVNYTGTAPSSINGLNLGVDAIEEFSVLESVFGAQYGRAAGGIVNAITRSGSNEFHGGWFYFHRNDNLDARNFFDGIKPPEFRRHQFGGSLGGPLVRNKLFFFANYEGLREARGNTTIDTTLSDDARRGILTAGSVPVDPVVAKVLELYPRPNGEVFGDTGLFIFANPETGLEDFVTSRIDFNRNDFDRLFFRYSFDNGSRASDTNLAVNRSRNATRTQSAVLENSRILSPRVLNAARFAFLRTLTRFGETSTHFPAADDPALSFVAGGSAAGIILVQGLTDFPGGSGSLEYGKYPFTSLQGSNDLTWTAGSHLVRFGGRLERTRFNTYNPLTLNGEYRFNGIREFLTNTPDRLRAMVPGSDPVRGFRQWVGAAYAQDSWRISPRVTLDLGLRHEWASVPTEVNGKISNLDELTSPAVRIGDPLFDNPSLKNFAPRAGLAWDLDGKGSTVVRSGYGIFPDLILSQYLLLAALRNPPFFLRGTTRNLKAGDFPSKGFAGFIANPTADLRVERFPRDISQPYLQHWNLNVEQRLAASTSLRINYTGSHGLNLSSVTNDADLATPVVQADGRLYFPADGKKLNPNFSQIRNRTFDAQSFYHGMHVQFVRSLSRGIQTQFSYSFSKSIDDSSSFFATSESDNSIMLPINGSPRFNRGLSSHDIRHYAVFSGLWELPSPRTLALKRWLGGWQLGSIASFSSGLPFSARLGYDAARTRTTTPDRQSGQRPDLAPSFQGSLATGDPHGWIKLGAFLRPQAGFLGNVGRNTIPGPNRAGIDLSLARRIRPAFLGERASLSFRVEAFNLLNQVNFDLPAAERTEVFSSTSTREDVGRITSAASSREIQLGLRLRF